MKDIEHKEYNPFVTALHRKKLSKPMKLLLDKQLLIGKILDFGTGYGFDVKTLKEKGYNIEGYDKFNLSFNDEELLNNIYDTITCFYMFNVIYDIKQHQEVLHKIKNMSQNVYIAVRSDFKSIKDEWVYKVENMCYRTNKSYQRIYNTKMIEYLFGRVEYVHKDSSLLLFKLL